MGTAAFESGKKVGTRKTATVIGGILALLVAIEIILISTGNLDLAVYILWAFIIAYGLVVLILQVQWHWYIRYG